MFCPRCGQQQISPETRFCSRCGFLMAGVGELLASNGQWPSLGESKVARADTPRRRGLKKGLFIFLLAFLVVPLVTVLTVAAGAEPFAVVIALVLLTAGGMLRAAYALMFESNSPIEREEASSFGENPKFLNKRRNAAALPAQQSIPVDAYAPPMQGNWRDTNDLTPPSVTESTTKLLQKEK